MPTMTHTEEQRKEWKAGKATSKTRRAVEQFRARQALEKDARDYAFFRSSAGEQLLRMDRERRARLGDAAGKLFLLDFGRSVERLSQAGARHADSEHAIAAE